METTMIKRARALITGASGQDGWYLSKELAEAGWDVFKTATEVRRRGLAQYEYLELDVTDEAALRSTLESLEPDVVFNLAASSSVSKSWDDPVKVGQINGNAVLALLRAIEVAQHRASRPIHLVQASSAEVFGGATTAPQNEHTPLAPVTPYGAAKAFAQFACSVYRERAVTSSCLVLYNHESPRRPIEFLSRKVTRSVAGIARGSQKTISLGNLDAVRDWGWAPDVTHAMVLAANERYDGDLVIATGEAHSVRDFVSAAFAAADIPSWDHLVEVDERYFRSTDAPILVGDASRARDALGWYPTKTFEEVVQAMFLADYNAKEIH